ncbi:MAG: FAD-dependent oxidoreductase, partial [Woeseiaceae bacterium]
MSRIVVMGAGIGGITQAYELKKELPREHEVVLVSDSDRFEFTPSNPWVAVGWRQQEKITINLPELMKKHGIEFHSQGVRRLHPHENRLEMEFDGSIDYDYLVIATGPRLAFE